MVMLLPSDQEVPSFIPNSVLVIFFSEELFHHKFRLGICVHMFFPCSVLCCLLGRPLNLAYHRSGENLRLSPFHDLLSDNKGDNRVKGGVIHKSPGICLKAEENWEISEGQAISYQFRWDFLSPNAISRTAQHILEHESETCCSWSRGQRPKSFMIVRRCHLLLSGLLANGNLSVYQVSHIYQLIRAIMR